MELKKCKYEDFTIEKAELLIKTDYITEIICDGDNKTIGILEAEYIKVEKTYKQLFEEIKEIMQPVANVIVELGNTLWGFSKAIYEGMQPIINTICELSKTMKKKKLSKKKFIKLLKSKGIQRNEINKIIKNNKEEYTYLRCYNIVSEMTEEEQK